MKILSICGSPRKGNSEAIIFRVQQLLKEKGVNNEVVLLREKKINRCLGCVEYCNQELKCRIQDDMQEIMEKMEKTDGFVFISPNYYKMPTGLFKDFIDRTTIFYVSGKEKLFKTKKAVVICVGEGETKETDTCTNVIAENYCRAMGLPVVAKKSFQGHGELKGSFNGIFKSGLNPNIEKDLQNLVDSLTSCSHKGVVVEQQQGTASAQVLLKIAEIAEKQNVFGPENSSEKIDELLWKKKVEEGKNK